MKVNSFSPVTGGSFTADNAQEIKDAINANADILVDPAMSSMTKSALTASTGTTAAIVVLSDGTGGKILAVLNANDTDSSASSSIIVTADSKRYYIESLLSFLQKLSTNYSAYQ